MGYRRALLTRWSRRDKLAILVIAVTVAFLTGTTLVVAAVSTQTTTIAEEYGTHGTAVHYDSVTQARQAAGDNALVVPVAAVELPNGATRYVAGISDQQATALRTQSDLSLPPPPKNGVTSGVRTTSGTGATRRASTNAYRPRNTANDLPRDSSLRLVRGTTTNCPPIGLYWSVRDHAVEQGLERGIPSHGVHITVRLGIFYRRDTTASHRLDADCRGWDRPCRCHRSIA